ncbi:MAG: hypothetical protein CMH55_03155 [Myxococcales bacterium]|nr:hypothetical protein [Myxococcales bacterium]
MAWLRGFVALLWAFFGGALATMLCLLALPLGGRGNRSQLTIQRVWARITVWLFGVRLRIEDRDRLPEGPCIVVANHRSNLDIFVLISALRGDVRFIAKMELMALVPISIGMWSVGHIFVRRSSRRSGRSAVLQAEEQVRNSNAKVLFFPEGTRSLPDAPPLPWRMGAFALAVAAQVPVQPIAVIGTSDCWPPNQLLPRAGGEVTLRFLPPLQTQGLGKGDRLELKDRAADCVAQSLKSPPQA